MRCSVSTAALRDRLVERCCTRASRIGKRRVGAQSDGENQAIINKDC